MFLDVDLRSRELVIFRSVPGSTDRLDSLFEVHMQVVFHKDAEPEMTKKKFLTFEPNKISEETYLSYTRADDSFRHLSRHIWFLPALALMKL